MNDMEGFELTCHSTGIYHLYASAQYKLITEIFRSFGGTECIYDIGAAFRHIFKSEILTNWQYS